jgi:pimeloyl-ACP methyl ester carboxylesterase
MREGHIVANGIEFAFLEEGSGPLLLLLHGYPDNAWTWERQMAPFAGAGYRVVAPFLRGYPPTEIPARGYYDRATLALDVKALIEVLAQDGRAHVVGQDWGAAMTYGFLAAFPDLVRRAVVMSIPHDGAVQESLVVPEQIHRAFHWWFFQLPTLPEQAIPTNDFAFISYLWDYWSPGHTEHAHVQRIKATLRHPGAVAATVAYYRAALNPTLQDPALVELRSRLDRPISVPTLALCGADDVRAEPMKGQSKYFSGPYRFEIVSDCGHFLHREKPADITRLVLDWLAGG